MPSERGVLKASPEPIIAGRARASRKRPHQSTEQRESQPWLLSASSPPAEPHPRCSRPRARAAEAPAADEEQAAELRAKLLAFAAAQRERTDWEARRLHQLMRAVDEEHSRERAATLEKAAAEDAKAFAEESARKAEQRAKSDEAAAVRGARRGAGRRAAALDRIRRRARGGLAGQGPGGRGRGALES